VIISHTFLRALLLIPLLLSGCREDAVRPTPEDPLFDRYLALGNSITAGFESEGVNDSTQNNAYSVEFARRFNAPFAYARLRRPGCPAPLVGSILVTSERVSGARVTDCALLHLPLPRINQSLAVPGIRLTDALTVPAPTGRDIYDVFLVELYRLIFGGRSLVGALIAADPTLLSVWLGQNDVLSAVTAGNLEHMTPLTEFDASLNQLLDAIVNQTSVQDVVWLSVLDPLLIPLAQPGAYFWLLERDEETRPWLRGKTVDDSCMPLLPGGAPNPQAANLVSARVLRDPATTVITCTPGPFVLTSSETAAIQARVAAFNQLIQERVDARGWIYIDTNAIVARFVADPSRIRKCQALLAARTAAQLEAALRDTCPHPSATNFFGSLVSFDGVHPSAEAQRIIADEMELAVRSRHRI
jgi:hypothetical protein